jgi:hypothetical protein
LNLPRIARRRWCIFSIRRYKLLEVSSILFMLGSGPIVCHRIGHSKVFFRNNIFRSRWPCGYAFAWYSRECFQIIRQGMHRLQCDNQHQQQTIRSDHYLPLKRNHEISSSCMRKNWVSLILSKDQRGDLKMIETEGSVIIKIKEFS